ncbi:MAG: hypothetical protein JJE36_04780 [Coriobacteriia bacterium]|nr:hypothetical protein [Coriobacteriia bacterium]
MLQHKFWSFLDNKRFRKLNRYEVWKRIFFIKDCIDTKFEIEYNLSSHREHRWISDENAKKDNDKNRLPQGERLDIPYVWAIEYYSSSTIIQFVEKIQLLGISSAGFGSSLADTVANYRHHAVIDELCLFSIDRKRHENKRLEIPNGVDRIEATLVSLTSSLTAVVFGFEINPSLAGKLQAPLSADYKETVIMGLDTPAKMVKYLFGIKKYQNACLQIGGPTLGFNLAGNKVLEDMEHTCTDWIAKYLPGEHKFGETRLPPTALLCVTENDDPYSPLLSKIGAFKLLGFGDSSSIWRFRGCAAARVVAPIGNNQHRMIIGCRYGAIIEFLGLKRSSTRQSIGAVCNRKLVVLMAKWGLSCLLDDYYCELSSVRDAIAANNNKGANKAMKEAERTLLAQIFGMLSVCKDVDALPDSYMEDEKKEIHLFQDNPHYPRSFNQEIFSYQRLRSREVEMVSNHIENMFIASTNFSNVISNRRTQKIAIIVALISVLLSFASLTMGYFMK